MRKIIDYKLAVCGDRRESVIVTALCDDGTIWIGHPQSGEWTKARPIPQDEED